LGLEGEPELTTTGIIADRRNVLDGDPIIVPNMVLLVISQLLPPRHSTMILCTMPSDGHWGTVDAGFVLLENGGVHQEDKPYLVGMGVVGKGMGVGVGVGGAVFNRIL
jgi:hypothetical protein